MALAGCPRVKIPGKETPSPRRAMGGFHFDIGCDLIASQDFLILTLFPLLKKYQLPFLLFTLVLEANQTGERLWNEEGKIAQKPSKCKKTPQKILCPVKT